MDRVAPACLRIRGGAEEDELAPGRHGTRDRHARDVAVVIDDHVKLRCATGWTGCHKTTGPSRRYARKELGDDAIVGAFCGTSRHEA